MPKRWQAISILYILHKSAVYDLRLSSKFYYIQILEFNWKGVHQNTGKRISTYNSRYFSSCFASFKECQHSDSFLQIFGKYSSKCCVFKTCFIYENANIFNSYNTHTYEVNYMQRKYHLSSLELITRSEYGKQACKKKKPQENFTWSWFSSENVIDVSL